MYTHKPINYFNSVAEASRQLQINPKAIYKALKSNSHISNNYYWAYNKEEEKQK